MNTKEQQESSFEESPIMSDYDSNQEVLSTCMSDQEIGKTRKKIKNISFEEPFSDTEIDDR